ncbi:MAG TPA: hypothetical protein VJX92_22210 [Methylomirabilota bacterium]|nr:hypothetical protein [Methylomirabilota bacterium]
MASLRVWISFGLMALIVILTTAPLCLAQTSASSGADASLDPASVGTNTALVGPWEFTVDGRIGVPTGRLKVGEFPPSGGGGTPGTLLRLRNLGIDVSGALEGSAAFHVTLNDAVRASYLYYFLRGSTALTGPSVVFNGQEFSRGSLDTNADFYRISLAYERTLISRSSGEQLVGSVGLTYVNLNPTLTGSTPPESAASGEAHGKSNSEDFYRQELPVPILGLRWDHPLGRQWLFRAAVSGGGLPRVDSLRQEGGTVYLQQSHADAGIGLAYIFGPHTQLDAGYHFTYFFQHEKSHEDNNIFELIDNGGQVRFTLRF